MQKSKSENPLYKEIPFEKNLLLVEFIIANETGPVSLSD